MRHVHDPVRKPEPGVRLPECGYRCSACMGTNTVIKRDELKKRLSERLAQAEEAQKEFEGRI